MSNTPVAPTALAIVNARVWTNDARRTWVDAVLVRGERILAVGSSAELRKRAGAGARIVDARGRLVMPSRPDGVLAADAVANLVIVERGPTGEPRVPADDSAVVFSLVEGRIELDRESLAP
jgi:hypothetical protein